MRDSDKLPVLAVIWGVVGIVLLFAPAGNQIVLAIILGIAAAVATAAITGALGGTSTISAEARADKLKRSNRLERLMEVLDDDTLDELEDWMESRRGRLMDDRDR